jgi:hypothetical protein
MNSWLPSNSRTCRELQYRSLRPQGHALTFPCDAHGRVDLDALSERERLDYLYARAVVGRELALPSLHVISRH